MRLYFKHTPETNENCENWQTKTFTRSIKVKYAIVKIDDDLFTIWQGDERFGTFKTLEAAKARCRELESEASNG